MAVEFFNKENHKCISFTEFVPDEGIQCNQFIIVDNGEGMLLDPGGHVTYKYLVSEVSKYFLTSKTKYIFASHADPDIIASINGWLLISDAKVVIAEEWVRFIPHFCNKGISEGRIISIPHSGMKLQIGRCVLHLIPAHYLHSVGTFNIYDPVSKILFSSDIGASLTDGRTASLPVENCKRHMVECHGELFHKRYMTNNKICRLWVQMVRKLDVECIVPQHGGYFQGKDMVNCFLDWIENLECGTDLISESDFQL